MTSNKIKSGVTLIEIILYMALASFILVSLTMFLGTVLSSRVKNQTIAGVELQGAQVIQQITQTLRNAETILIPAPAASSGTLSIEGTEPSKNPTVFGLAGNTLTVTEGLNQSISLTTPDTVMTDLVFQNLSRDGTAGMIRISFTLARLNPEGRNEYEYSKTFYTSVSLR